MSDDTIDLAELDAQRKLEAIDALYKVISDYNASKYDELPPIEEVILYSMVMRMAAAVNVEGHDRFPAQFIVETTAMAVRDGRDLLEQGQKSGQVPRPFKLIKPGTH